MSSMAKIFVVVNLVFAIVVFGSAATLLGAQDDYKSALAEVTNKFDEYKAVTDKAADEANAQVNQQKHKAATELARANKMRDERDEKNTRLAAANSANETLNSTMQTLSQEVAKANKINEDNKSWLDRLAGEVKKATQDALNAQKALEEERGNRGGLEQEIDKLNEQVQQLSAKLGDTERALRESKFWLDEYRKRFGDITGGAKGSKGIVNAVRDNLVSISVGSADNVRQGDVYHIRRGGTYVGQITINHVEKNQAVGAFDTQFPGPGAPPQNGDVAYPDN